MMDATWKFTAMRWDRVGILEKDNCELMALRNTPVSQTNTENGQLPFGWPPHHADCQIGTLVNLSWLDLHGRSLHSLLTRCGLRNSRLPEPKLLRLDVIMARRIEYRIVAINGPSEWSAQHITKAWGIAQRLDLVGPIVAQPEYNLLSMPKLSEIDIWLQSVGGKKKERVKGLGSLVESVKATSNSTLTFPKEIDKMIKSQVDALNVDLYAQLQNKQKKKNKGMRKKLDLLMKHVYNKSSSNDERPSQEDNQAYEDESDNDSDDVNESDNHDNINESDSDPDVGSFIEDSGCIEFMIPTSSTVLWVHFVDSSRLEHSERIQLSLDFSK
ncbi:putative suppressor protein SRP40-like isoform X2 [Capsicum annuum]|nr:putative suppressor protein SRP40-like isoform X2 [Capsicum annuum]